MRLRAATTCLPLFLVTALVGCGGSADPAQALEQGKRATQSNDHETALGSFQQVVKAEDATVDQKFTAQRGVVVSEAYLNGDEASQAAFASLLKDHDDRLSVKVLAKLGQDVATSGCADTALTILEAGTIKAGDDAEAKRPLEQIVELILSAGADDAAMAKLRSLGYIK